MGGRCGRRGYDNQGYVLPMAKNNKEWSVESVSLFADFTYHVSDTFDVIFGGRFTRDKVTNSLAGFGIAPGINPGDFWSSWGNFPRDPVNTDSKYTGFSPRLVLKYAASDDLNLYANISKGYKAGGNSVGNDPRDGSGIALPFNKEELWNYEVGFKSVLMDGNMRLNGSFFFLDWEDLQVETFRFLAPGDLSSNFEQTTSVEEAEAMGMELEMLYAVDEQLTFSAGVGMLDTEITSDTRIINYMNPLGAMYDAFLGPVGNNTGLLTGAVFGTTQLFKSGGYNCLSPMGTNALGVIGGFAPLAGSVCTVAQGVPQSLKGNKLPNTADSEYSLSLTQVFPSARGETLAKLSYRYRSESNSSNFEEARMAIPDLKVWDLFVRFNPNDDDWYVGMYAKNLADDRQLGFLRTASNLQGGQLYGSFSDPRTFGVQFGTSF